MVTAQYQIPSVSIGGLVLCWFLTPTVAIVQVESAARVTTPVGEAVPPSQALFTTPMDILNHRSIVHIDDGEGGGVETLRIGKINRQIVHRSVASTADPENPEMHSPVLFVFSRERLTSLPASMEARVPVVVPQPR